MRHMEWASLWTLVALVLLRVLSRGRDSSRSVRSFFMRFGLLLPSDIRDPPSCGGSSCLPHIKRAALLSHGCIPIVPLGSLHPLDRCLLKMHQQGPLC